jgi:hypothetical protein
MMDTGDTVTPQLDDLSGRSLRIKRWAGDNHRPAAIPHKSEGSDAFYAAARIADRGRSVRTKIPNDDKRSEPNDGRATTKIQQSHMDVAKDRMLFRPQHELPTVDDPPGRTLRTKMTAKQRQATRNNVRNIKNG